MEYIPEGKEADIILPTWKVTFGGQFFIHRKTREPSGKPLPFSGEFDWAGRHWLVPGVYCCREGLVVDLCMEVDPEQLQAVRDKWNLTPENDDESRFSREKLIAIQAENPFHFSYSPQLVVNGETLQRSRGCGVCYAPFEGAVGTDLEAQWVVEHYQLDKTKGWYLWRWSFPWVKQGKSVKGFLAWLGLRKLFTLSLRLHGDPVCVPGKCFQVEGPGDTAQLDDPTSGKCYTLTVVENEARTLNSVVPKEMLPESWEYPNCYRELSYTLEPEPPEGYLTLQDCAKGDQPRMGAPLQLQKVSRGAGAASIGIIGGADGPTAIFVAGKEKLQNHTACSSFHFQPVEEVNWLPVFHKQTAEDTMVVLKKTV